MNVERLSCLSGYPLDRKTRDLARIVQVELFFDMRAMRFDRLWTQMQVGGNFSHVATFTD
jgi:hypothetical protein